MSANSSRVFDAVSCPGLEGKLDVRSSVKCDVLEVVDVFVSSDENDEMIFMDYSRKAGMMLGISGTGGMKRASAVKVYRSRLLRARIVLDQDVRHSCYIASRPRLRDEPVSSSPSAEEQGKREVKAILALAKTFFGLLYLLVI